MRDWRTITLILAVAMPGAVLAADGPFSRGLPQTPESFPLAVWLQAPSNARRYRAIGINTYVALWRGPNEEQLDALDKAGIRLICEHNARSLRFKDRPTIVGWMHGDEPDNAQSLGSGKGYGPPIPPATIVEGYRRIRQSDPERPVMLNLGQGVAWDGWYGRGVRTNHPEDYREYLKGCDIASFDIYPASHENEEIAGKLWYVPQGVDRLRRWTDGRKDVWCCIETTRIENVNRKPTPQQVRSEVWMALIRGARGIIYFAHQFKPKFIEAGLLADDEVAREVAAINRQIQELAPVLHSHDVEGVATVASSRQQVPIDHVVKRHGGRTYLFAVSLRGEETSATFSLPVAGETRIEVLGEGRTIEAVGGVWQDRFAGYQVHLYRAGPAEDEGWTRLFDGKSLDGWTARGGSAKYAVEDGAIVGTTAEGSPNTFLCKGDYRDFVLELEVRCDPRLNSGVQVRSHVYEKDDPDPVNRRRAGVVYGPQCEIARKETATAGRFYDEGRRGRWLAEIRPEAKEVFDDDGWNRYRIVVQGDRYRSWVNGQRASDFTDKLDERGFIGLQVHGIAKGEGPYQVRWRNIRIRELKPGEPMPEVR